VIKADREGKVGESVREGLLYYKKATWVLDDDIVLVRPVKRVFEVFVGFDSEFERSDHGMALNSEDAYLASLNVQHVAGDKIFQELSAEERKRVVKLNKNRSVNFSTIPISYQLSLFAPELDVMRNDILLTRGRKINFREIVAHIALLCFDSVALKGSENAVLRVYLISHFSLAELQTFKDFHKIKTSFDSIRGTFITTKSSIEVNVTKEEACLDVEVILCDTSLLAPAGFQSLTALGKFIGISKIENSDFISKIGCLLRDDPEKFYNYAITDSVITLAYWMEIHMITQKTIGPKLFQSVGGLSIGYLKSYLKRSKISRSNFFGCGSSNYDRFEKFAVESFMGGRNESFSVGLINDRTLFDVDLSGAYSVGMMHIPQLDFANALITYNIEDFSGVDVVGFGEVEFKFPENVVIPSIPVKTKNGLVYPRAGVAKCTSYEIFLAKRLGAELKLVVGVVIPAGSGCSVLKRFVKDVRFERSQHKKGTLANGFYKLIMNSLYGRFAMGIHPKKYFDTRTGLYSTGGRDGYTNAYLASSITGFIRAVVSELIHELSVKGCLVVSVTTDGFITDAPFEEILRDIDTPFVKAYKRCITELGDAPEKYLELKGTSENLFSWKTRGQFDMDKGLITAMAGLQKPKKTDHEGVKAWFVESVVNDKVKAYNKIERLLSLTSVYKGSPFGSIEQYKYISTQYDFKRRLVKHSKGFLFSEAWSNVGDMSKFVKRYVSPYQTKIRDDESLREFELYINNLDIKSKAERARKVRLIRGLKRECLYPIALKTCVRCALKGEAGFSQKYTGSSILDLLLSHGIKDYGQKDRLYRVDSNFFKNQKRLIVEYHKLPLTVEVYNILKVFKKLDSNFNPNDLLLGRDQIADLNKNDKDLLINLLPLGFSELWAVEYHNLLRGSIDGGVTLNGLGAVIPNRYTEEGL
jgi:hypothetical protein